MLALAVLPVSAQQVQAPLGETASDYRFHVGPVGLAPTFALENLGIDTNATRSEDHPVRDVTFRATPGTAYLLPFGRFRLYGNSKVGFQYYQKTRSQRSVDALNQAALSLVGNRFAPRVFGNFGRQRTRPNAEIEATVGQLNRGIGVGADLRFSPRFVIQLDAEQNRQNYEEQLFRGAKLNTQLNRTTQSLRGTARLALTPITTLTLTSLNTRDQFEFSHHRDANSTTLLAGFETQPSALIAGSASVGYRLFNAIDSTAPDYHGVVTDVSVAYTLFDRTRFGVTAHRGVEFSAEAFSPYYLLTSGGLSITQMLGRGWDIQVGADGQTLAYREFLNPTAGTPAARVDHVDSARGGFGFRVGDTGRVGFEIAHSVRRSPVKTLSYEGWLAGVKVSYGT
jgi:hypothetical protein